MSARRLVTPGHSLVRLHPQSRVLREEWFIDPSYLVADDGKPVLFVHQFVEYQTPKGRVVRRGASAVWAFDSEDAMASAVEDMEASEGHPGDVPCLDWIPEGWEGAAT